MYINVMLKFNDCTVNLDTDKLTGSGVFEQLIELYILNLNQVRILLSVRVILYNMDTFRQYFLILPRNFTFCKLLCLMYTNLF